MANYLTPEDVINLTEAADACAVLVRVLPKIHVDKLPALNRVGFLNSLDALHAQIHLDKQTAASLADQLPQAHENR